MKTQNISYFILLLLTIGCANIKPPQGGPEDNTSATLNRSASTPDSLHLTNFSGNKLQLLFNEKIVVQNLNNELSITPYYDGEIKHNIKKAPKKQNILELTFDKPFKPNTTYTLNFGKSIRDLREGNITPNLNFAFSTGPYLDSLKISGSTINQFNGLPMPSQVFIYDLADSSRLNNGKPTYITSSNNSGKFIIEHIKSGNYYIYGLTDINNNLNYDISKESIAFNTNTITLDSVNTSNITLQLFRESLPTLNLQSIKPRNDHHLVTFNKPISEFTINNDSIIPVLSQYHKSIKLYSKYPSHSLHLELTASDSINNQIDTIFSLESISDPQFINQENFKLIESYIIDNQSYKDSILIQIKFNQPIQTLLESNILFITDIDTTQLKEMTNKTDHFNKNKTELNISIAHKRSDSLEIQFKENAVISILQNSSDPYTIQIPAIDPSNFGILGGSIITKLNDYQLYLLNSKNEIVKEIKQRNQFQISLLKPDTYSFLVTQDLNNNGHWDNGQLSNSIQPEPRIFLPTPYKLKANWEINNIELKF